MTDDNVSKKVTNSNKAKVHRGRRGHGSITQKGRSYYAQVSSKDPVTGKRSRRWSKGCATKLAAQASLKKMLGEGDDYTPTRGLKLEQLVKDYIFSREQVGKSETTIEGYRVHLRRLDAIGKVEVERLTAAQIDAFYARLATKGLSSTTRAHVHNLLNAAFRWALKKGRINRNPIERVDAPQRTKSKANTLQVSEAKQLLDAIRGHRLEAPMVFALGTGMRRGEVIGLRWASFNADRSVIVVQESRAQVKGKEFQKETKTEGVREVPLGALASEALRLARKQYAERKLKAGKLFIESGFVFTDEIGSALKPNALTDAFRRVFAKLEESGLPHRRLHDLRHTAGTLMLASGIDLNTVQQVLGHSNASTTLNVYGHVLAGRKQEAIDTIDAALSRHESPQNESERKGA